MRLLGLLLVLSLRLCPCHGALVLPLAKRPHVPHALHGPSSPMRRASLLASMPVDVTALGTGGLGQYIVPMSLGTPAQTYYATLDTGSGLIHVPCATALASARAADPQLPLFNPAASSTLSAPSACTGTPCRTLCGPDFPAVGCPDFANRSDGSCSASACVCSAARLCEYGIEYADHSQATGGVYSDKATFNGDLSTAATLAFGCATNFTTGLFTDNAPYFVGINWQPGSLLSQLEAAGVIDDTFGICLGDGGMDQQLLPLSSPENAADAALAYGMLVLGSATLTTPLPQTFSTTLIDTQAYNDDYDSQLKPGAYPGGPLFPGLWIQMTGATIGSTSLMPANGAFDAAGGYPMLLDSGTSLAAFPGNMMQSLVDGMVPALRAAQGTIQAATGYDPTYSYGIAVTFRSAKTPTQLDSASVGLPTLDITLGPPGQSVTVPLPPSRYLFPNSTRWPDTVWVFYISDGYASASSGILGNSVLRNWWIQATRSTRTITIGLLNTTVSCDSLAFDPPSAVPSPPPSPPPPPAAVAASPPPSPPGSSSRPGAVPNIGTPPSSGGGITTSSGSNDAASPPTSSAPGGGGSSSSSSSSTIAVAVGVGVGVGVAVLATVALVAYFAMRPSGVKAIQPPPTATATQNGLYAT